MGLITTIKSFVLGLSIIPFSIVTGVVSRYRLVTLHFGNAVSTMWRWVENTMPSRRTGKSMVGRQPFYFCTQWYHRPQSSIAASMTTTTCCFITLIRNTKHHHHRKGVEKGAQAITRGVIISSNMICSHDCFLGYMCLNLSPSLLHTMSMFPPVHHDQVQMDGLR